MSLSEEACEAEIRELGKKYMERFAKESDCTVGQFVAMCRMELSLADVPGEMPADRWDRKLPASQVPTKDGIDVLLDSLETMSWGGAITSFLAGTTSTFLLPIPIIVGALKTLKKWIFGEGQQELPDVDEWNRQQEEYAQKRQLALRQVQNQISIQMGAFEEKIKKAFLDQLETVYEKGKADIDEKLREREGRNSERMRQQDKVLQIKSDAELLLERICGRQY